jgi:protein phosphatase
MIRTERPHLDVVALTHPGETGKNNEDRHSVTAYTLESNQAPCLLAVVADGIGGHQAGEIASQLAVETFVNALAPYREGDPVQHLHLAMLEAGQAVSRAAQDAPEREGMGSTLGAAWVIGWRLYLASIGDSRIYLQRAGRLQQLTIDHTWVQEAIDHKIITPAEARGHPNAHVLRRHLGSRLTPQPDLRLRLSPDENDQEAEANQGLALQPGDRLLMSTDGLTDLVEDKEMNSALRRLPSKEAVETLVRLARTRGGFDNITAVLLEVPGEAPVQGPPSPTRLGRWLRLLLIAFTASVILAAIVLAALAAGWRFGIGPWSHPSPTPGSAGVATTVVPSLPETETGSLTPETLLTSTPSAVATLPATSGPTSTPIPLATVTSAP